jgi:hypothetical protein
MKNVLVDVIVVQYSTVEMKISGTIKSIWPMGSNGVKMSVLVVGAVVGVLLVLGIDWVLVVDGGL